MATVFTLRVRDSQAVAVDRGDLKRFGAYGVTFSTILPGGDGECKVRIPYRGSLARLTPPSYLGYNYRLDVTLGGIYLWSGRIEDVEFRKATDGYYWEVTARGYGMNLQDQAYTAVDVANKMSSTIVSDAITALAPQITAQSVTSTSFTFSNNGAITPQLMTVGMLLAWIARFGDSAFNPQQWYVYPDSDGTIRFTFEPRPTTTDVEGYLADFPDASFGLFGKNAYNRAVVRYNGGASYVTRNDSALQGAAPTGWNLIRTIVAVLPELNNVSAADANQAGDAMLKQFGTLRMAATSLRTPASAASMRLYDSNGSPLKPWEVKAGQLFRFRDVDPVDQPLTNLTWSNAFVVAGTTYDEDAQTLSITPEGFDNSADKLIARVDTLMRGRFGLSATA